MLCKWCGINLAKKTFCSQPCRNAWTAYNNKFNNPMKNPSNIEKMRQSKIGQKQTQQTKDKRAESLKKYNLDHPEAKITRTKALWEKYTSKIAGTAWLKISRSIRERDNFTCQNCGETDIKRLLAHHIDWRGKRRGVPSSEWNNDPSNLVTLCHKCHNALHRHKSEDYHIRRRIAQGEHP